jgi:hypothetical protein
MTDIPTRETIDGLVRESLLAVIRDHDADLEMRGLIALHFERCVRIAVDAVELGLLRKWRTEQENVVVPMRRRVANGGYAH